MERESQTTSQDLSPLDLRFHAGSEGLIQTVSRCLVNRSPGEIDEGIHETLAEIGHLAEVDRAYVFQFSEGNSRLTCTHEWCASGIEPVSHQIQHVPVDQFPWMVDQHLAGREINLPRIEDLPPEAAAVREELDAQGIRSVLSVSIQSSGAVLGFIGLDSVRSARGWSDPLRSLLSIVSQLLAHALFSQRREEKLSESEEKYRRILETAQEGIWLVDQEGGTTYVNQRLSEMLGYTSEELTGRTALEFVDEPMRRFAAVRFARHRRGARQKFDILLRRKDGSGIWASLSASPILDADGAFIGSLGMVSDISTRKQAEEERLKVQKLESLSLLAGGIAHDFNNYLTAILGNLSLAMRNVGDEPKLRSNLERMEAATLRAKDLTTQLLTFARGGEPVKRSISLTGLVREAAALSLRGSNVHCQVVSDQDLWTVDADRGQIGQVVHNLVLNADQAMTGGGRLRIRLSNAHLEAENEVSLPAGRYVVLSVTDDGPGISAEHAACIFDPYFTTREHGSGLGLTVAHSIVEKHGGRITVETPEGGGAEFKMYLPAARVPKAPEPPVEEKEIRLQGRVLVMDDEEFVRVVAAEMLGHLGLEADTAANGEEAIEKYERALATPEPFSAVLMDLTVPGGMGGKDAVQRLLEIDPEVRAIVSSGYSSDHVMSNFREFGFRGVVVKPYRIQDLRDALQEALSS